MLYFALIGLSVIIIGLRVTITGVVRLLILFSRQHKNIIDRGFEPMNPFTGLSLESSCFNHLHKRIYGLRYVVEPQMKYKVPAYNY